MREEAGGLELSAQRPSIRHRKLLSSGPSRKGQRRGDWPSRVPSPCLDSSFALSSFRRGGFDSAHRL